MCGFGYIDKATVTGILLSSFTRSVMLFTCRRPLNEDSNDRGGKCLSNRSVICIGASWLVTQSFLRDDVGG